MPTWQITLLFATAGCAIGCLVVICRAIQQAAKAILAVGAELKNMNTKLESIQAVGGDDTSLEAVEAALSNFEKLKRIDKTEPQKLPAQLSVPAATAKASPPSLFSSYR